MGEKECSVFQSCKGKVVMNTEEYKRAWYCFDLKNECIKAKHLHTKDLKSSFQTLKLTCSLTYGSACLFLE